jgi:hypothetical protein
VLHPRTVYPQVALFVAWPHFSAVSGEASRVHSSRDTTRIQHVFACSYCAEVVGNEQTVRTYFIPTAVVGGNCFIMLWVLLCLQCNLDTAHRYCSALVCS